MFGTNNYYSIAGGGVFGIPMFIGPEGVDKGFIGLLISVVVAFVGGFILTYLFGYKNAAPAQADSGHRAADASAQKEQGTSEMTVFSPLDGEWIPLSEVQDEAFSSGAMGKGAAIIPTAGAAYAPFSGTVHTVFKTKHAIGMISGEGAEILIHIGINTVKLKGEHFTAFVKEGDTVKKGDKLVEFDLEAIQSAGYDVTTSVLVSNTADYAEISVKEYGHVRPGDPLIFIK